MCVEVMCRCDFVRIVKLDFGEDVSCGYSSARPPWCCDKIALPNYNFWEYLGLRGLRLLTLEKLLHLPDRDDALLDIFRQSCVVTKDAIYYLLSW